MPFDDRVAQWSAARPDHTAFVLGAERVSYRELYDSAVSLARAIRDRARVTPRLGRRWAEPLVAVSLPNSVDFVRAFTATTIAGATVAVLDPAWAPTQSQA